MLQLYAQVLLMQIISYVYASRWSLWPYTLQSMISALTLPHYSQSTMPFAKETELEIQQLNQYMQQQFTIRYSKLHHEEKRMDYIAYANEQRAAVKRYAS